MQDRVTISWTLLFLSVLHVTVWSLGVTEEPAKDFYVRQTNRVGEGGVPERFRIEERQLYLQEKLLEERRIAASRKREIERSEPVKLHTPPSSSTSAQEQTLSVFLPQSSEDPSYQ